MAKDPAFLFYSNDFDVATKFFSHEQVGKYLRLLITQHQHGHLSEQQMKFICGTYDKEVYAKFKQDENGLFYNERLESELIKRSEYSKSRSENRKGKPKKEKKKNNHKNTSKSYDISSDIHMENENENTNELEIRKGGTGGKPVSFQKSKWFDKNVFLADCPDDWSQAKREHYYEAALAWSEDNPKKKKVDWIRAVRRWDNNHPWEAGRSGTSTRPQTENQRIRDLVNNNTNLVPEADRYVEVPDTAGGVTMTGRLFLDDDGLMKFVKAGRIRLTVDPQNGFKPSAVYKLAPGMTIDKIYESLLIEKRKSA